jgi:hypothetical protein
MLRPLVFFIIAQPFLVLGFIWLSAVRFASANADLGLSIQLSGLHEFAHRNWGRFARALGRQFQAFAGRWEMMVPGASQHRLERCENRDCQPGG